MSEVKLTEAQRKALEWVGEKARRPWAKRRKNYPKMISLEILVRDGLVERTRDFPYDQFSLSDLGRSALALDNEEARRGKG
ncbi:hypothetical protein [Methylobacterium sp. Leaf106]|uniref:hypothetical protein n=1 Tax=Methylobacterium sp. Leaf106 TaxID=1736255 RepID=UPI0006F8BE2E|nr:hypothetical protein [Methylobacterium sp. Leaf106]KQP53079.1 hypothetical protein ASF34_01540 [Methylobacterium sp. Leaf106]